MKVPAKAPNCFMGSDYLGGWNPGRHRTSGPGSMVVDPNEFLGIWLDLWCGAGKQLCESSFLLFL